MFWHENIPRIEAADAAGRVTEVTCIAGRCPAQPAASTARFLGQPS